MNARLFLVLDRNGAFRVTKRAPFIGRGELCVRLAITIPDACFTAPVVSVNVDVPADQVRPPEVALVVEDAEAG